MSNSHKTPLYNEHVKLNARIVDFAGWMMPVQYEGLKEEHAYTRNHVGLFDVSHMGEIRVKGPKAVEALQWLTTNDVATLEKGQAHYSLLPNDQGGLVDDIFVYCLEKNADYLVCVNASNKDKDFTWMTKNNKGADITDESSSWGQIAIQGPKALQLCDEIFAPLKISELGKNQIRVTKFKNFTVMIATTGYTGEKGCEIFVETHGTAALWQTLIDWPTVKAKAIGLGARDSLRTEMKFSLYGHEIDDTTNPYEAGLGWAIKPNAKDFLGKATILKAKEQGLKRKLVGFKMLERGIPRQGYEIKKET
ncbi:MAG: glycine cleavage system aminomethyltransferase GcvT, partial [Bdellovibrionaceae bacterium]|nr:glycine cleavage system aminomethyltransferase GcvT [Bdellovibrio sp.]